MSLGENDEFVIFPSESRNGTSSNTRHRVPRESRPQALRWKWPATPPHRTRTRNPEVNDQIGTPGPGREGKPSVVTGKCTSRRRWSTGEQGRRAGQSS